MSPNASEAVTKVLESGFVGQGEQVEEFEQILRNHFGTPFVNTVNSCTSGLELAVHMMKTESFYNIAMQEDDEIITTPLTCAASIFPILSRGVKVKWADVDPKTCNIDLNDVMRKLTPKTKGIMLVHWGGYPVDLDQVKIIQKKCCDLYGFIPFVIEDCAHAWGSKYKDKLIGTHGNICVFSFQAIKSFTTCDGGAIICPTQGLHERAKLLRWYGLDRTASKDFRCGQNIQEWGMKWHMNNLNAAIGIENYGYTNDIVRKHQNNAKFYNEKLQNVNGITLLANEDGFKSSSWIYTIMVQDRPNFVKKMREKDIEVGQVHDRNDKHDCLKEFKMPLPSLDKISQEMNCIPCGWWITNEQREYIVDTIKKGW